MCGTIPPLATVYSCDGASLSKGHLYVYNFKPRRQCTYNVTLRRVVSITYSECGFVASVIQRATRMRRIILSCGLSGCTISFHVIINGTIFGKKVIEHKICVLSSSANFM
jgi:hypothetical protein